MLINHLKKGQSAPVIFTTKNLKKGNGYSKFFTKDLMKDAKTETSVNLQKNDVDRTLDASNLDYKYIPYLKPMEIKGIKRADRKLDYNSSYSFMRAQKDYNEHLTKPNIFVKYLYNGMKTPLPPKKYKISEYVDVRLDMFAPFIICGIMSIPFFIAPCL